MLEIQKQFYGNKIDNDKEMNGMKVLVDEARKVVKLKFDKIQWKESSGLRIRGRKDESLLW